MKPVLTRIIQGLVVLSTLGALVASSAFVRALTRIFVPVLHGFPKGTDFPFLTEFALAHAGEAWKYEMAVAVALLAVAALIVKKAPTPDAASTWLLLPVVVGWVFAFQFVAMAALAYALPFVPIILYKMDQT